MKFGLGTGVSEDWIRVIASFLISMDSMDGVC